MRNLITRAITGIIFISLIISSFFLPWYVFAVIFLFFTIVAIYEYTHIARQSGSSPQFASTMTLAVTIFVAAQITHTLPIFSAVLLLLSAILFLVVFIVELYRKKEKPLLNIATTLLPLAWIVTPFALSGLWAFRLGSANTVLAIFIFIWLYDTLAYCTGSLFGKHRLFERISPKKSWEGFILSLILTTVIAAFFVKIPYFATALPNTSLAWIGFALTIIISSTFGDLVESLFKRSANVKDSGTIFPGHGGILDRFDSFFFALPAGFVYYGILTILC
ncbi:phosphatidate cytidylyltransferase [Bacteroidales bacterium OttesenSCG-928-B11]|nr:phosphatidate cytidylyltransferase [Bacteroidales bacterium OttesenSCG-928-E04]MDL2308801.1 phosphatidate cytidylyltransferase [Bacteroidales bacterium OttesenSCG-928-C03]MDL2312079.1 phosphatidate cytidylyltransferase [Bacteroidales bacterium OttesenSCG-928-B11]MDL2325689.1 phosphatidate cytidylyltransferase [Bacteroidales bacterium OttesenSCG-928-A14]